MSNPMQMKSLVQTQGQTRGQVEDLHYHINKGVNRPIEFRGLKAQYIYYLAIGLAALLILFSVLYISGTPVYLDLVLILILGAGLFFSVGRLSRRYGAYGLHKWWEAHRLPTAIRPGSSQKPASVRVFRGLSGGGPTLKYR